MSGSAARNSLADIFAASGELPPHPLLERIQRNPVGMNRFEDSMTVPTPGIDPLAGFVGAAPVNSLLSRVQQAPALDTFGYGQRDQLFPGEDSYFRQNPHVGGMAAEDGRIILNPYSPLKPEERAAVARNEGARLFMREREITPKFSVTDEQRASFAGTAYASDEDAMRQTLAARIISGDPSARATAEQIAEARAIFGGAALAPGGEQ